ncbi:hypothetical protein HY990_01775 [Candidatus Micrarchaeota archaeon]|nr:hypothetical protein [Candidatus Micrarchaeota archaeon]
MIDIIKMVNRIRIPLTILIALTCVGILINSMQNTAIIAVWWILVFVILGGCLLWTGYNSAKNKLSLVDSGLTGIVLWLIPGTVGLTISGINVFISALLWGSIEGYEIIAFLGGLFVILVLLAIGSIMAFIITIIGRFIGQKI